VYYSSVVARNTMAVVTVKKVEAVLLLESFFGDKIENI
jgi:hypothetical protein